VHTDDDANNAHALHRRALLCSLITTCVCACGAPDATTYMYVIAIKKRRDCLCN